MSSVFVRNSSIKERMKAVYNGVNRQAVPEWTTSGCTCISLSKGHVLLYQTSTRKRNDTSQIEKISSILSCIPGLAWAHSGPHHVAVEISFGS